MGHDRIENDETRVGPRGGAQVLEDLNTGTVRPVVYDEPQKESCGFLDGLRLKEIMGCTWRV